MKIIGITGKCGSGKSTISAKIATMEQAEVIDADKIAKKLSMKRRRIL